MSWIAKKVLVTGGAGQIGSNLVKRLVEHGAIVSVADNLWRGKKSNLCDQHQPFFDFASNFHQVDLTDFASCCRVTDGQELVFHLADVVAGINYVFGNQFSLFNTNLLINSNMLRAAISTGVAQYVYVGTACSYPAEKQNRINPPPLREDDVYPASPESSYGWSKLMGELECDLAQKDALVDVGILRFHNVYGPRCEMSPEKSQVIPSLIRKAINYPNEEFLVWGSGNQRRAFVYVEDAVDSLIRVVQSGMNKGVIQIGPDTSVSIREIAERVVALSGKNINIRYDPTRREGDIDRVADWSKARETLGWSPKTDIDEGLEKTYRWCHEHLANG